MAIVLPSVVMRKQQKIDNNQEFNLLLIQFLLNIFSISSNEKVSTFELKNKFVKVSEKKKFPQKVESFIFDKNQFGCKKSFYIFQFQTGHELISKMEQQIEQWLNYPKQKVYQFEK
ncbi:Hypothetical_protein [Hexamita inflata]|uniref:Hypothetical_protein n=1 Tax=Hexamita inflata TaxID=28002 RepID=A0AA86QEG7_9EUKA|nr:Hypothetical protein HINF_LOCUS42986 [Hexamita inflata]